MIISLLVLPGASLWGADLEQGKALYNRHCSVCHGDRGDGASWARNGLNPPPRNFTAAVSKEELSRERMVQSVTHGRSGTAMMPFATRLSEVEIANVVDFIRAEFMGIQPEVGRDPAAPGPSRDAEAAAAAPPAPQASFPHDLVGNFDRGKTFYENNCYVCHGLKGDGKGPRADFIHPKPRDFNSGQTRQRFDRPALYQAIARGKRGTVMPAWSAVLDNQQIANVAEYVYRAFILVDKKKQ